MKFRLIKLLLFLPRPKASPAGIATPATAMGNPTKLTGEYSGAVGEKGLPIATRSAYTAASVSPCCPGPSCCPAAIVLAVSSTASV